MKRLYVIRHAKASALYGEGADHERPLAPQGKRQLLEMKDRIRAEGAFQAAIYSSSAVRARETVMGLTPTARHADVHIEDALYTFDYMVLVDWLRCRSYEADITIVGHNPAIEDLAFYLCGSAAPDRVATCAFLHIALAIDDWVKLARGTGELITYVRPAKRTKE